MTKQEKQESLDRIMKMEAQANQLKSSFQTLSKALHEAQNQLAAYTALQGYYYSEDWENDRKFSDSSDFPPGVACGVLSEDEIYNILSQAHDNSLLMLELALALLK